MDTKIWTYDAVIDAVLNNSANLEIVLSNYFKSFVLRLGEHNISIQGINSIESLNEKVLEGIEKLEVLRKEFISVVEIFAPSKNSLLKSYLPTFFEDLLNFYEENGINLYTGTSVDVLRNDHYRFFNQFLFISLTALLLENECFDVLKSIVHTKFIVYNKSYGKTREVNYIQFQAYNYTLNQYLNNGPNKRVSVTADYVLRYNTQNKFDKLIKADILLYYLSLWNHTDDIFNTSWFPELSVYNRNVQILPKMASKVYFERAKALFEVKTVDGYKALLKETKETLDRGVFYNVPKVTVGLLCDTVGTLE